MHSVEESILIDAPPRHVFRCWRAADFATFMVGVVEVRDMDRGEFLLRTGLPGQPTMDSRCQILLEAPERRLAWRSLEGPEHAGVVAFEFVGGGKTFLRVKMRYAPDTQWGEPGAAANGLRENLRRFKTLAESGAVERST